ncbi:serine hydrolase [Massilia sp. Dwa41.01b]|uniref:serine hydrolase n=1 Tax=unclassified Massilia TaxID=2609279 RepID=UPI0016012DAA|nr:MULTISPECIES: serine hydrolase [unclassified Massilia]QNA87559.1 serine hydrolase [Massilia sp. Dwa41.01b]QNA98470.1 serine hydrolase [Massilia sp. Se16.2.3]
MKRIAAAILIAFSSAGANAWAETPAAPAAEPAVASSFDLEQDVTRVMKAFDVPGIAIAIVKDGQVVAAQGFGVRKLGEPARVDGQTLFEIASNSKAFTAAALAMLVDEGKLKWDDPVVKHLPDFQMYDAYVTREMTVRDLLTHRSGLGLGAGDLLWWPTTTFTTDEIIERLRYIKPATSFRSSYAYDNLLYIVAGKIIAQKSGQSWGDTVRERILNPIGMTGTTTSLAENAGKPNASNAHSKINDKIAAVKSMPVANAVGAVGINTNAEDIARWMKVLLDGGVVEGKQGADGKPLRLWSEAQSREMWTAQTPMKINTPKPPLAATKPNFYAYGLGFQLRDYRGQLVAMHGGALQGFYSRVLLVPESKLGIAILTNAESGGSLSALQYRLLDQYMSGSTPTDWIKLVADIEDEMHAKELARLKGESKTRAAASKPSLPLASYEGQYQDPWYGTATVKRNGSKLTMSFSRTPDLTGEMEHYQHDTFIVRWKERNFNADSYATFSLDHDGSIASMKMKAVSTETDFSYDFHDLLFTPVKAKEKQ